MPTYIEEIGAYVPEGRIDGEQFSKLTGKEPEWFVARTGIHSRSRAGDDENTSTMGVNAVRDLLRRRPDALAGVDLVIGASYTPEDTLSTMASRVQREFGITSARVYFLSTACSSFISALELAQLMLRAGEASKALIVVSEHNSIYSDDADRFSGHLWGDGAAAAVVSADAGADPQFSVDYVRSRGVACSGKGPDAISLNPALGNKGLVMGEGRDVFARACEFMAEEVRNALDATAMTADEINWLVPHQANLRILNNVAKNLGVPESRCAVSLDELGNTGCASIPITISRTMDRICTGHRLATVAFGGGYSCGAAILTKT